MIEITNNECIILFEQNIVSFSTKLKLESQKPAVEVFSIKLFIAARNSGILDLLDWQPDIPLLAPFSSFQFPLPH